MSGSEGESGKRTGGNAGTAPRLDPTPWNPVHLNPTARAHQPASSEIRLDHGTIV